MNRSPLFYPLNRGMDADAGGAADLQTDVMRFMAIISLCLVAIFALVQSIPIEPVPPAEPTTVEITDPIVEPTPEIVEPEKTEAVVTLVRPERKMPERPPEPVVLERPVMKPVARVAESPDQVAAIIEPVPVEPPAPVEPRVPVETIEQSAPPTQAQEGFSLRFESDAALTRLVARNVVGLYAISPSTIHRMNLDAGAMSFWPASAPQRFHEMDVATVPSSVLDAWRRGQPTGNVKWGVSIPAPMAGELDDYLNNFDGGSLVIGLNGELRRENY